MKFINYTISCIHFSALLTALSKKLGFIALRLPAHQKHKHYRGVISFEGCIDDVIQDFIRRNVGIYFFEVNEDSIVFPFSKIDSNYYNILYDGFEHDENPFAIKTFRFCDDRIENAEDHSLMLYNEDFIHITKMDDEIFIYKVLNYCYVCSEIKISIRFNHLCTICLDCFQKADRFLKIL